MRTILPSASLTLNELAQVGNAFEGHRGRPGQRGGSLPRSAGIGSPSSPSSSGSRSYSYRPSYEDRPERQERQERVVDHEEINRRIAHGLQSDDPEIRLRAKAAKARYEMYQARQQVYDAVPPALTQAQTRKLEHEATNPLHRVPEMKEGETFTDHALRSFIYAMESLDKPGRIVRGALGGKVREIGNIIPFSDYLGITRADQAVSGRDLLQKIGIVGPNTDGFDAGDVAGFIVDAFTDPLMYVGGIGAISRSAKVVKVTRKTLNPKTAAKIATDAEKLRRSTYLSLKRKGNTEATAKRLATIKSKKFLEEGLDAAVDRANVRARAAKPVKFGTTESVKTKGKKVSAEAAAAAKKAAVSTGRIGGTPAAAVMMLLDAVGKLPIAGELIRRVRKRIESKMGKVTARVREKTVNPTVKILGKEFKTGVKKPTTVGALVGKANKTTVGHPKFKKTKLQLQELAKYANQAHAAGKTFLEATGVSDKLEKEKAARKAATNNALNGSIVTLVANFSGGVRNEKWQGKDYIVAPLSLIVEGVLNGSKGPLHYPMSEIKQNYSAWNGTPIVVYHPTDNSGNPIRAKDNPEVLNKSIGVVRNACIKHPKLVAEGWFDAEKTKEVDPRVYNALTKGQRIELSTGLHTDNEPANNGAQWNGRAYTHVARNYRPDHLAILPDQQGACSLNDGCGVLVNTENMKTTGRKSTNVIDLRKQNGWGRYGWAQKPPERPELAGAPAQAPKLPKARKLPKNTEIASRKAPAPKLPVPKTPIPKSTTPVAVASPPMSLPDKIRHERDTRAYAKPLVKFDDSTGTFNCGGCDKDHPCDKCNKPTVNGWLRRTLGAYGAAGGATLGGIAGGAIGAGAGYLADGVQGAKDGALIGGGAGALAGIARGGGEGLATGTALETGVKIRPKIKKRKKPPMSSQTLNGWTRRAGTAGGAIGGGLIGGAIGSATGAVGGAIAGLTTGHGLKGAAKGALLGAAGGGTVGGAIGAGAGGTAGYVASTPADKARKLYKKIPKPRFKIGKALSGENPITLHTLADGAEMASDMASIGKHVLKRGPLGVAAGLVDTGVRRLRKQGAKYRNVKIKKPLSQIGVQNLSKKDKNTLTGGALSGAIVGTGRGALVGSLGGPAGTLTGAAGGAVIGGVAGALGSYGASKLASEFKKSRIRKQAVKKAKTLLQSSGIATNEWSDEARAASLEVRRGNRLKRFAAEQNIYHNPNHHADLAAQYRRKAMQARRPGLLRGPNEEKAVEYEAMAGLHEATHLDPAYHAKEAEYHRQSHLESEDKAMAGSGSSVSKGIHITGYGAAGGVAGVVGGHLAGKAIGKTVGRVAGMATAKIAGGVAGGALGTLVGGVPGGVVGAAIGSSLGKAVAKPAGIVGGAALGSMAGRATGVPGAGVAGGVAGYFGSRFGRKPVATALGKAASKVATKSPEVAAWGAAAKGAAQATGQAATAVSKAATEGAAKLGGKIGEPVATVSGEILGGLAGTVLGARHGYKKAKAKASARHEDKSELDLAMMDYHNRHINEINRLLPQR